MQAVAEQVYDLVRASFDYHFRKRVLFAINGGPLNGQRHRQQIVLDMLAAIDFEQIYETGCFFGSSTEFFADHFNGTIVTIECNRYYHRFTEMRLRSRSNVQVIYGDSVACLGRLASDRAQTAAVSLFYLDAHWFEHLPLRDELRIVLKYWPKAAIVIDDFEVPDDPGYRFDDYGEDMRLCLRYLAPLRIDRMQVFFPAAPSDRESGGRRGCVVITTDPEIARALAGLPSLRMLEPTHVEHPNFAGKRQD
jgi:predicted O-methyltransferase YrrM